MTISWFSFLTIVASPFFSVMLLQAILNRVYLSQNPQKLMILSMLLGFPLFLTLVTWTAFTWTMTSTAYVTLFYSLATYTYFHIFNMSQTARRIRLIMAIGDHQDLGSVSEPIFEAEKMIEIRLQRLLSFGQIQKKDDKFLIKGRLLYWAAVVLYAISKILNRPWRVGE